jgi:RNA polymerase sigma-70 factor (ECF subfamily)
MDSAEIERDRIREEFVHLFQRYERGIYGYILSLVPNIAAADEISQNTNLVLWKEFGQFDAGKDFGAWARAIAYYQVLSFRNAIHRDRVQFDSELLTVLAENAAGECEELVARQSHLMDCLAKLAEPKREIIRLHHCLGMTVKAVAQQLGRSAAAVEKTLLRARRALFDCVEAAIRREEHR